MSKSKKRMPTWFGPLMALVLLSIALSFVSSSFLTLDNWMNILRQASINSCVALGMLMVLLTGGIDLSVGPMVALTSCTMGVMMMNGITNPLILILAALAVGICCGGINGLLFTKLKLPHPFVSTMGSRMVYRGLALLITGSAPIAGFSKAITFAGSANIGFFPVCFLLVIIIFVIAGIFLGQTPLGRKIYSVGGNKEAARLSGINVFGTLNFVYIMSGVMCAIAGIIMVGRVGTATPLAGETFDMDDIAACVIGGASFLGGKGTVQGTLIGAVLIAIIRNGLNLLGAQTDMQYIVIGCVIILAVLVDVIRGNAEITSRRKSRAKTQLEKKDEE
ncbi:MAG: ABC transporter permease [Firmicutes bacterium]|nr:ABC transporter permease [Bacillota bacterium]